MIHCSKWVETYFRLVDKAVILQYTSPSERQFLLSKMKKKKRKKKGNLLIRSIGAALMSKTHYNKYLTDCKDSNSQEPGSCRGSRNSA